MSYEGHEQVLCEAGHLSVRDAYWYMDDATSAEGCPVCREPIVFTNQVDDTNCDQYGIIPDSEWEKFLRTPQEEARCNLGHLHVTAEATYRIPTDDEKKMMRHCRTTLCDPKTDPNARPDGLVCIETYDFKGEAKKYEKKLAKEARSFAKLRKRK